LTETGPPPTALGHRAETWVPVFGKDDAITRDYSVEVDSEVRSDAVEQNTFRQESNLL
jgi:hypothetical protein